MMYISSLLNCADQVGAKIDVTVSKNFKIAKITKDDRVIEFNDFSPGTELLGKNWAKDVRGIFLSDNMLSCKIISKDGALRFLRGEVEWTAFYFSADLTQVIKIPLVDCFNEFGAKQSAKNDVPMGYHVILFKNGLPKVLSKFNMTKQNKITTGFGVGYSWLKWQDVSGMSVETILKECVR